MSAEAPPTSPASGALLLEVEGQVSGNDGDVHEVNHMLMLPPVQVLVDVQALWGPAVGIRLWHMLSVVRLVLTLRAYSVCSPHPNLAFTYVTPDQS